MSIDDQNETGGTRLARRSLLKLAAGASLVAAVPAIAATRVRPSAPAAPVLVPVGSWAAAASIASLSAVRAGWAAPCASRQACDVPLSDEVFAARASDNPGRCRVRVLGLANAQRAVPFRLVAKFGAHEHHAWSAWRDRSGIATSTPVALPMPSEAGVLPFELRRGEEAVATLSLPAQRGVYIAPLSNVGWRWRTVAFSARDPARPLARELTQRGGAAVSVPYLLFAVEHIA